MMTRYRGYFWPAVLVLIGLLALLVNTGVVPADRLYRLWDLWPALLIVIGLEILVQRSRMPAPANLVASILIVLIAVAGAAAYVAVGPPLGSAGFDSIQPAGELTSASMEIDVGGATVTATGDSGIGENLYRAHIAYSGPRPDVSFDRASGAVRISQNSGGLFGPGGQQMNLDLRLNTSVTWSITVNAGGAKETMRLGNVPVSAINLNSGGSTGDITLGAPHGTVPINVNGAGVTLVLHRPAGSAATVRVSGAAVSLTFDGRHKTGLGSIEDSSGEGPDAYDVTVSGAGCNVTMDATASG